MNIHYHTVLRVKNSLAGWLWLKVYLAVAVELCIFRWLSKGLAATGASHSLTDLASWCWLLAGGLSSFPRGPLYSDTWIISQDGSWLPPQKAIQEIARRIPLHAFMSKFRMPYCPFHHILFTKSELLSSTHTQREGIRPCPPENNERIWFVDIFLNYGRQLSNK